MSTSPWKELLPTSIEVGGAEYEIRSDYRAVLDICSALSDVELEEHEKVLVVLDIFYPAFREMPPEHCQEAIEKCLSFVNCDEEEHDSKPVKLMDWEQDFKYIVAPINRVIGTEIRTVEYMHWWTFLAAYYEIGDCLFAQIVRIRKMKSKGKPLDKSDQAWYRENRKLVDMKANITGRENEILKQWGGG